MKKVFIALAFFTVQLMSAQEADIKKTIETFFTGFNSTDIAKVKSVCSEKLILQSVEVHTVGNKFTEETAERFFAWLTEAGKKGKFEEKVKEYKIQTDGHIANVWAPYEFYYNGEFSHSGVDSFSLIKTKEGWKILYLIDTRMP